MGNFVVLGAGKPRSGSKNPILSTASYNIKVFDWIIHSVRPLVDSIVFVGGYQAEEIIRAYPGIQHIINEDWHRTGATYSFLLACAEQESDTYVSYGDILFRGGLAERMRNAKSDICIAVDSAWRSRFSGRTEADLERCEKVCLRDGAVLRLGHDIEPSLADAEFIGFVKFSARAIDFLKTHHASIPDGIKNAHLTSLIEFLRLKHFSVETIDAVGDWAELHDPADLARYILGTKAQTLHRLQGMVQRSRIEDQISFTVSQWVAESDRLVEAVQSAFHNAHLVVRSSALSEDGFSSANAGAYTSVLKVDCGSKVAVRAAVEEVIASYPDKNPANEVLVQPMVKDVVASGVAFTRTLAHGAPYYVINYDDITRSTESITSGASSEHKTLLVHRGRTDMLDAIPDAVRNLIPAITEIEALLDFDSLDIEFAISEGGFVHILQVRPIAVPHQRDETDDSQVEAMLEQAEARFAALQKATPFVLGDAAYFGVMPDWNPAEIIGTKPSRMAMSLYRYLIMDTTWSRQRAEYGYRDVRPHPLLVAFAGHPYVDIRASFNSFVPATVDDELAARLVNFYLGWLADHPHLHDKVEFDVVPTCYALDFDRWQARLTEQGDFSLAEVDELKQGLKLITRNAFKRTASDLASIAVLEERFDRINASDLPPLEKALVLLEDCKRYGTLAFAHLARSAFVAVTLLRSGVNRGVIEQKAMDSFLGSIRTVTHEFTESAADTAAGRMPWEMFVERYGHLRPGTYDLLSPAYRDDPEHFLAPIVENARYQSHFEMDDGHWRRGKSRFIKSLIMEDLIDSVSGVEQFMRDAIEGREYAKFAFTRNLSTAIDCIVGYGSSIGLERAELSHISIDDLMHSRAGTSWAAADDLATLKHLAKAGREAHRLTSIVELPPLVTSQSDLRVFLYPNTQANFVGSGKIRAECVDLHCNPDGEALNLTGRIALIPQADPGYDWLFGQNIGGLITMYGGANSHMAIRSAEFGLPAAIGVGETKYASLARAQVLELDAGNRRIQVIR